MALKNPDIENDTKPIVKKRSSAHFETSMSAKRNISIKQEATHEYNIKDISIKQEATDDLNYKSIQNAINSDTSMDETSDEEILVASSSDDSKESSDDSSDDEDYVPYKRPKRSVAEARRLLLKQASKAETATTEPQKPLRQYNATEK